MKNTLKISDLTKIAMTTAILAVLAQLSIPLPLGVPLTLQTLGVYMIGLLFNRRAATWVLSLYILLGTLGVPVFSNFSAGPGVLLGPTGGYIFGFFLSSFFLPIFKETWVKTEQVLPQYLATILGGVLIVHACGILQFSFYTNQSLINAAQTLSLFIPIDFFKAALAVLFAQKIKKRIPSLNDLK